LDIRKDRLELRKDQATLGAARQELKNDLRNRPMLRVDSSKTGTPTVIQTTTPSTTPTTAPTLTSTSTQRTRTGQFTR
jgi:hypothetical protein